MKFRGFRTLRLKSLNDATSFLNGEFYSMMKTLFVGLTRLNFEENFDSFERTVKLPVGQDIVLANTLGKAAPSKFLVTRNSNTSIIIQGSVWDSSRVSVINKGPVETVATIVFMR